MLSEKQEKFCIEFAKNGFSNGKQAAIAAGYSSRTAEPQASRLLRSVKVKAFLDGLKKDIHAETRKVVIDRAYVLEVAHEAIEKLRKNDKKLGLMPKFLDILGKHVDVGAFDEKMTVNHQGELEHKVTVEIIQGSEK